MPAGRTHNTRVTALALAVGVNGAFLLLLQLSHEQSPAQAKAIVAMIWIDPVLPPPPPSPGRPAKPPVQRRDAPEPAPAEVPPVVVPPAPGLPSPPGAAIDLPWIDWSEQASRVARDAARNAGEKAGNPLDSEPEVMVLPRERGHPKGHVEHLEGGATMTFDGDCVINHNPQAMQPWALDPVEKFFGQSASARWSSKSGGCRADQTSRKRATALEKAVKPRHLGGKRPLPEEDGSSIKIP